MVLGRVKYLSIVSHDLRSRCSCCIAKAWTAMSHKDLLNRSGCSIKVWWWRKLILCGERNECTLRVSVECVGSSCRDRRNHCTTWLAKLFLVPLSGEISQESTLREPIRKSKVGNRSARPSRSRTVILCRDARFRRVFWRVSSSAP